MMMRIDSPDSEASPPVEFMSSTSWSSWKLYHNPFYNSQTQTHHLHHPHCRLVPQFKLSMADSDLDLETELIALKAELVFQIKARKKAESVNRRLSKELAEERRARAEVERACGELARRMASEIDRMKAEMEEERKMLRMAQVIREERIQMKLADAKIVFEQKLSQLEQNQMDQKLEQKSSKDSRPAFDPDLSEKIRFQRPEDEKDIGIVDPREPTRSISSSTAIGRRASPEQERNVDSTSDFRHASQLDSNRFGKFKVPRANEESEMAVADVDLRELSRSGSLWMAIQRRVSPEKENPHIKRGIKGFVEFPRVVRAMGSRSQHWATKLECRQTARLKILLKQKPPTRSSSLILS